MSAARDLFGATWRKVDRDHPEARSIADRHYSRQTVVLARVVRVEVTVREVGR